MASGSTFRAPESNLPASMVMGPPSFRIRDRLVGEGQPCFIVAEVAQAHDGSLGTAHAFIDAAADAGADAVKFQTHIADAESTPGEPFRIKFSKQDASRYDYWRRMEFTEGQWRGLASHADDRGIVFLSSPFSTAAIELLERLDIAAWKIGSGETSNLPTLERLAATKKPVLLSSGMSDWSELDQATGLLVQRGAPVGIYQCTTAYPCPPERVGLNVIAELRARYGVPVGLSDHSGTIYAGLAAASLGASMLEVHITFSRRAFGPDVPASITIEELAELVRGTRFIERALANPVDKAAVASEFADMRKLFTKSVVLARDLPASHQLAEIDLDLRKPGSGWPAARMQELVGRRLKRALPALHLVSESDLE